MGYTQHFLSSLALGFACQEIGQIAYPNELAGVLLGGCLAFGCLAVVDILRVR